MPAQKSCMKCVPKRASRAATNTTKKHTMDKRTKNAVKKLAGQKGAARRPLDGLARVSDTWIGEVMAEWLVIKDWNTSKGCRFMRLLKFVDECLAGDF